MNVRLLSSDNKEFIVQKKSAEQSVYIENMMVEGGDCLIPLPNVTGMVLEKVIEWCDHHCDYDTTNNEIERQQHMEQLQQLGTIKLNEWDQVFFQEMDQELFDDVIRAANYLDIKGLLDITSKVIANKMRGMTPTELKTIFNFVNDLTPEEEAHLARQQNY